MVREEVSRGRRGEQMFVRFRSMSSLTMVVGHHDADQRGVEHADRPLAGRAETDGVDLRQREGPHGEALANMPTESRAAATVAMNGRVGRDRATAPCDGRLVLVDEQAVEAADRVTCPSTSAASFDGESPPVQRGRKADPRLLTSCRWAIWAVSLAE